ncbi:MAG: hypothetical protein ETSY2_48210 [Candidatus Entotheonella gemina]|uniref:Uncharacterized protein n=1 Tax=Candidatus Entotheonella gemina TaxID=1429439 RepID=W4LDK6_9BACT|nr:MAG: hypothetical protein ETSY2_48210 [Candidatus Entotheonella gemina]
MLAHGPDVVSAEMQASAHLKATFIAAATAQDKSMLPRPFHERFRFIRPDRGRRLTGR